MSGKRCPCCGEYKPASEWSKCHNRAGGLGVYCLDCKRQKSREYYSEQGGDERKRRRYAEHRNERLMYMRGRPGGQTKYNPDKSPARRALYRAVRSGKIVRPDKCELCGKSEKVEAHHHQGYDKDNYLQVQWLCRECHNKADHPEFAIALEEVSK